MSSMTREASSRRGRPRLPGSRWLLLTVVLALQTGCPAPKPGGERDLRAEAKRTWSMRCARCHGATGNGMGPQAAALNPKPRSFRDPKWQASVDDEHIRKVITGGGAAVGKSVLMPAHPDLARDPQQLEALVRYVRGLVK